MPNPGNQKAKLRKKKFSSMDVDGQAAVLYIRKVRQKLHRERFQEFVQILAHVKDPESDKIQLINRVVTLLEGYPELILGFNTFIPSDWQIELQNEAVLIKVFESVPLHSQLTDTAHEARNTEESLGYVRQVKHAFWDRPQIYQKFMTVLYEFHQHDSDQVQTIKKVIKLFHDYPALIVGFNAFLPKGYKICMYEPSSYIIHQPRKHKIKKTVHYDFDE